MAQGTLNIINQGFPSFRADLNDQLEALATLSSGPTAPTTTYPFQLWVDTSVNPPVLKQRNAANNAFVLLGSAAGLLGTAAVANTGTGAAQVPTNGDLGTMSTQNANDVAITGGSADGTSIGASTASTGSFTTLAYNSTFTGGTGVVNLGSGQFYKNASGNVGIGTSSPASILHIQSSGAANSSVRIKNTGAEGGDFSLSAGIPGIANTGFSIYDNDGAATRLHITSAGLLQFNSGYGSVATAFGCRAWVNFNGTLTTGNIRASGNVSSVTRNNTGRYTVNFSTAMPDANFSAVADGYAITGDSAGSAQVQIRRQAFTTTSVGVRVVTSADIFSDAELACVQVFR